jgi:hypothetical protein
MLILLKNKKQFFITNINAVSDHKFPDSNGAYSVSDNNLCNDSCPICTDKFKSGDKIIYWPKCKHPYHDNCYNDLKKHKHITCSLCRNELNLVDYSQEERISPNNFFRLAYGCSILLQEEKKTKLDDCCPIYTDIMGTIFIRYKVFCYKYNFVTDNDRIDRKLYNIKLVTLLYFLSLASNDRIDELKYEIKNLLKCYALYHDNLKTIINNLITISDIFNLKRIDTGEKIELKKYYDELLEDKINRFVVCTKTTIHALLLKFIYSIEGKIWFHTNNSKKRANFYQTYLQPIVREKYRSAFKNNLKITYTEFCSFFI